jgi:hypothetical protein
LPLALSSDVCLRPCMQVVKTAHDAFPNFKHAKNLAYIGGHTHSLACAPPWYMSSLPYPPPPSPLASPS